MREYYRSNGKHAAEAGRREDLNKLASTEGGQYCSITFFVKEPSPLHSSEMLQEGITIRSRIGCNVHTFLREEIAADTGIINKIQSIVLDGKPIDDLETTVIRDGSVLALSAAMPGLVGATLRRGGAYASFRGTITHHETRGECTLKDGLVRVKIFNLLIAELGPLLLQKGVIYRNGDFIRYALAKYGDFWQACRRITLDGKIVDMTDMVEAAQSLEGQGICLSVFSDQAIA